MFISCKSIWKSEIVKLLCYLKIDRNSPYDIKHEGDTVYLFAIFNYTYDGSG